MRLHGLIALALVCSASACGSGGTGGTSIGSDASASDSDDSDGTDGSDSSGTDGTDSDSNGTDGSSDSTTSDSAGDTGEQCQAGDAYFDVSLSGPWDSEEPHVVAACTVTDVDVGENQTQLSLDCSTPIPGAAELSVWTSPLVPIETMVGEQLVLEYRIDFHAEWANQWLKVHRAADQELVVLATMAEHAEPPDQPGWLAPLSVETVSGVCDAMVDECGSMESVALELTEQGQLPIELMPGTTDQLQSVLLGREYLITVDEARLGAGCGSYTEQVGFMELLVATSEQSG